MEAIKYANPPIREAVFDVRFRFKETPTIELFEKIHESIADLYPSRAIISAGNFSLEIAPNIEPRFSSNQDTDGLRLTSSDGTQVVQVRRQGFAFSRLKPYTGWETFISEALRLLKIYVDTLSPLTVERIALRYVNAIEIPETSFDIGKYFKTFPNVDNEVPLILDGFFMQLILNEKETRAVVNQAIEGQTRDHTKILFDIDAFQDKIQTEVFSEDFNARLEHLRETRTKIFQSSLSDEAKALFV